MTILNSYVFQLQPNLKDIELQQEHVCHHKHLQMCAHISDHHIWCLPRQLYIDQDCVSHSTKLVYPTRGYSLMCQFLCCDHVLLSSIFVLLILSHHCMVDLFLLSKAHHCPWQLLIVQSIELHNWYGSICYCYNVSVNVMKYTQLHFKMHLLRKVWFIIFRYTISRYPSPAGQILVQKDPYVHLLRSYPISDVYIESPIHLFHRYTLSRVNAAPCVNPNNMQ